jgi:hypothetical protein
MRTPGCGAGREISSLGRHAIPAGVKNRLAVLVFKASWLNEVCAVVAELAEAPA